MISLCFTSVYVYIYLYVCYGWNRFCVFKVLVLSKKQCVTEKPYKYARFSWYLGRTRSLSIFRSLKIIPAPQCGYFGSAEIALFEWMIYKLHRTSLQFLICFGKNLGLYWKKNYCVTSLLAFMWCFHCCLSWTRSTDNIYKNESLLLACGSLVLTECLGCLLLLYSNSFSAFQFVHQLVHYREELNSFTFLEKERKLRVWALWCFEH